MRRLPAALLLPLALLLALGCGHDRPSALPTPSVTAPSSPTSTSGSASPAASSSAGSVSPSVTPTSVSGPGGPAPSATATAAAPRLAAPGTYAIAVAGSESFGGTARTYPASSTLDVSGTGSARTVVLRYSPDRDDTDVVDLTGGAVRLRRSDARVRLLGFTDHQVFEPSPPVPLLPADARVGQRFSGSFAGGMHGTYDGTVERRERVTVGGVAVDTLVVLETVRFSGDADGTTTTRTWWDPVRRLPVKQRLDSTATSGGQSYEQHVTITLQHLDPT